MKRLFVSAGQPAFANRRNEAHCIRQGHKRAEGIIPKESFS
jgi:hypothetical protein